MGGLIGIDPSEGGGGDVTVTGITGTVTVDNFPTSQLIDIDEVLSVTGTISTDNFPVSQVIEDGGNSITVDGSVSVSNFPADKTLSTVVLDYASNGANPVTNDTLVAAPGSGSKVVIYGFQVVAQGTGAGSSGSWAISNGNVANADYKGYGVVIGNVPTSTCMSFTHGVDLDENTACNITITETATQVYLTGVLYYRVEAV